MQFGTFLEPPSSDLWLALGSSLLGTAGLMQLGQVFVAQELAERPVEDWVASCLEAASPVRK